MTIDLRNLKPNQLLSTCDLSTKEVEEVGERLRTCGKPSKIAASFNNILDLQPEHIKHFRRAPYIWKPMNGGIWAGMLMEEKLDYVHLVLASEEVVKYILESVYIGYGYERTKKSS